MTQNAQESYYESLGRQTNVPFQDKTVPYLEVEPDLTKAVNENIDQEIKDTKQFFTDNANNFTLTRQAASGRWRDLANLTRDGRQIVQNWKDYSDELTNLQKLKKLNKDKAWKTQFDAEGIDIEKQSGRNLVDLNKELGKADKSIKEKGYYDTFDADGKPIRIGRQDYTEFAQLITSYETQNGRGTAAEAERHYDEWIRIAKKSVVHAETGLFWDDLSYAQKLEWKQSVDALYIQMWRKKDPNLSDRLIIKKLFPKFENYDATLFSSQAGISDKATEYVIDENTKIQGINIIRTMNNSIVRNKSYSVRDNIVSDEFYGESGWYGRRVAFHEGRLGGDKKAARIAANEDLDKLLDFGINNGMINEEMLDNVFTEWNYEKKDGSGLTSFMNMNNDSQKILQKAINTLKTKQIENDKIVAQTRLNKHADDLTRGKFMSIEDLNLFAQYPDLYRKAENIYNLGQKGGINRPVYAEANSTMNDKFLERASNPEHFDNLQKFDPKTKSQAKDAIANLNYGFIKARGIRYFLEQIDDLEGTMKDEDQIIPIAMERTLDALKKGEFDNAVNNAVGDVEYEKPEEVYRKNIADIKKDHRAWLTSNTLHFGEEIFAFQGKDFLDFGGPAPALYRELLPAFKNMDIKNLIYERLVALKMIDPADPKYAAYRLRMSANNNILESRLLTHYPTKSKALRYSVVNSENWKEGFKIIENPAALEHFDGTGAFKTDEGFSETIDLRTYPVLIGGTDVEGEAQDIFQLAFQNPEAEFGKYRIKGKQLLPLLQYMQSKGLLKDGQVFNEKFEGVLVLKALKFDANENLKWNGDTSYLSLFDLPDEDQELFDKLTGKDGENIPSKFNNLQFLINILVQEEINTKL
tara:strand:- start:572 stop:3169 length:2598 start_codon:yes stop_codon:yes gene_type:complete